MRLAVISIRGGSKCIPNKNRQPLCCLSILTCSIAATLEVGCFYRIIVPAGDEAITGLAGLIYRQLQSGTGGPVRRN